MRREMSRQNRAASFVATLLLAAAGPLLGQNGKVAGPVTGFVFDRAAGSLRPILGIPGASTMGDPLALGYQISSAVVAPKQDSAFAFGTDGSLHFLRLQSGAASEVNCAICPAGANGVVFSPSGTAAAIYSAGRVQVMTGLSATPAPGAGFALGRSASAPPMALSDDGVWLLAGTKNSVELFNANGGPRQLMETLSNPMVAFAPGSHDAAIADGRAGVVWIHDVSGAANPQQVAAPATPMRRYSGIAFSSDGKQLLTAVASEGSVVSVDLATGTSTSTTCGCQPSELVPMGSLLRLNEMGSGPLWLFDGNGAPQPRVVFVPALVAAQ